MELIIMVVSFVIGLAATLRGVAMLSPAAAWIVLGVIFLGISTWPFVKRS